MCHKYLKLITMYNVLNDNLYSPSDTFDKVVLIICIIILYLDKVCRLFACTIRLNNNLIFNFFLKEVIAVSLF